MGSIPKNISGSIVSAIAGLNPYKTPIDAWIYICSQTYDDFEFKSKLEILEEKNKNNNAIKLGTEFEPAILDFIEKSLGYEILDKERFFQSDDGISTCHLDGSIFKTVSKDIENIEHIDISLYSEYERYYGLELNIEVKTTSTFVFRQLFGKENTDEVPEQYFIQCQQQMGLSNRKKTLLCVLVFPESQDKLCDLWWPNKGYFLLDYSDKYNIVKYLHLMGFLKFYEINFNSQIFENIRNKSIEFWNNNILKKQPPPANGFEDLRKIFKPVYGTCIATPDIISSCKTYTRINDELERVEKNKDMLKGKILQYMIENSCDARKKEEMILLDNRGFQIARMGNRFTVKKDKDK